MLIYTSGTTGLPRGVAPPSCSSGEAERRRREYAASVAAAMPRRRDDVALVTLPFSHGAGPSLVRASVAAGNTIVLQRRFDAEGVLRLIEAHRVSIWIAVPTMLKRLAALPPEIFTRYDLSSVRAIQTGAAPVAESLKAWVAERFGPRLLHEAYGATEVGMIAHLSPDMQDERPTSSGRPHRHVDISVRDPEGRPLPPGETGELWVRTPMTIRNYLNGPPLDAQTLDGAGFFRTGDVGHLDEAGFVFITDRAKDMIISGGVNIYPAEIEAVLIGHPAVQDVAVIGIPDDEFGEQVKAFVEPKPGSTLSADTLLAFARTQLASYKCPKTVDILDELPRNAMGKLLKRDLRAPYWKGRVRSV